MSQARGPRVIRHLDPGCFAFVMATGIISQVLRQVGVRGLPAALLAVAGAGFIVLVAASAWRVIAFPGDVREDLTCPGRMFGSFTFVAACSVLGLGLAADGYRQAAAGLTVAAALAWLALSYVMPVGLISRYRARPDLTEVNGTWFLWVVGTQSLVLDAAALQPARTPAVTLAALVLWSAGVVLYLAITILVLARLLLAGVHPEDATPPYWVAMGAAAISVFAVARLLQLPSTPAISAARQVLTGLAVMLWGFGSWLIPLLLAVGLWRHLVRRVPLRYQPDLWAMVFPLGMYAMASLQLGNAARLPLVHDAGRAAAWVAAAVWVATFAAMLWPHRCPARALKPR